MNIDDIATRLENISSKDKYLKFSACHISGKKGYRWQSVKTSDGEIMQLICDIWNNRKEIAKALKKDCYNLTAEKN